MYDPRNGYRPMQQGPSSYAAPFLEEFRAAQRARCQRLDARALEWCEEARWNRRRLGVPEDVARMPAAERARLARLALQRRYFLIHRTLAVRDTSIPARPSPAAVGLDTSFSRDPVVSNYREAWLVR
jgi:hypothetical protein